MRHGCRIRTILKYFCNKKKQQAGGVAFAIHIFIYIFIYMYIYIYALIYIEIPT